MVGDEALTRKIQLHDRTAAFPGIRSLHAPYVRAAVQMFAAPPCTQRLFRRSSTSSRSMRSCHTRESCRALQFMSASLLCFPIILPARPGAAKEGQLVWSWSTDWHTPVWLGFRISHKKHWTSPIVMLIPKHRPRWAKFPCRVIRMLKISSSLERLLVCTRPSTLDVVLATIPCTFSSSTLCLVSTHDS